MKFLIASLTLTAIAILIFAGFFILLYVLFIGPGGTVMNATCHTWHPPDGSSVAWCYFPPQPVSATPVWQSFAP